METITTIYDHITDESFMANVVEQLKKLIPAVDEADQTITEIEFQIGKIKVYIPEISCSGEYINECDGDYWTPPSADLQINDVEIEEVWFVYNEEEITSENLIGIHASYISIVESQIREEIKKLIL